MVVGVTVLYQEKCTDNKVTKRLYITEKTREKDSSYFSGGNDFYQYNENVKKVL